MKRIFSLILLVWASLVVPLAAASVGELYEVEVPVSDQAPESRAAALRQALATALVKVSGYSAVAADPAVVEVLERPDRFVQQFRYRSGQENEPPLLLWVRFDSQAVNGLLRDKGLPVWGAARPSTLMWLAVEERGQRRLISAADPDGVYEQVSKWAQLRGIPVLLPLLDLEDQQRLTPIDVWGEFRDAILAASERYQVPSVLVGRVFMSAGGEWRGAWALYQGGQTMRWESSGADRETVVAGGVGGAADSLALQFANMASDDSGGQALVRVTNVGRLADYARVADYLDALNGVAAVHAVEVGEDFVVYRLQIRGSSKSVVQAISLGDTLVEDRQTVTSVSPPLEAEPEPAAWEYRLLK